MDADSCLLCGAPADIPPNASTFFWQAYEYRYARCRACRSLRAVPLPDASLLASVYGAEYVDLVRDPYPIESTKDLAWVVEKLRAQPRPGLFLDFGCGQGELLREVAELGWTAVGIEYTEDVARQTAAATGLQVVTPSTADDLPLPDVVHFGDVIEHLTDPFGIVGAARERTAPGALVLAQGPLEVGPSLFSAVVRPGLGGGRSQALPTHLLQATSLGQRLFFARLGLAQLEFSTSEVDWPAPSRLRGKELLQPRSVALLGLRRLSRAVDALVPSWGNRYRYAGRAAL